MTGSIGVLMGQINGQSTAGITGKPDTSYTIYSAYLGTKKTNPETKVTGEFYSASVSEKINITYCTIEKRKLLLDIFYPKQKNSGKRTAVILIHGGGWRSGNKALHHPLARRLAAMGYVCFTPEYRLSTEVLYPGAVYDIKAAIRWVRKNAKKYNIDTARIAAVGHSAGGELAAFMGATNNNPVFEGNNCNTDYSSYVNAVVDIDGILAFIHSESGEGDDSKRISAATNWFGYSKTEKPEIWKQGSPLTHAGAHTSPILFLNSSVYRMHAGREDYIKLLNQYNIYSDVKTFEGAPHSFCLFDPWFETTIKYIDDFFKKIFSDTSGR